jgi:hypothetical protein
MALITAEHKKHRKTYKYAPSSAAIKYKFAMR